MASPGRRLAVLAAAALLAVSSAAATSAQVEDEDDPCAGWGSVIPPAPGSRIATCVLPSLTAAELAGTFPDLPLPPPLMVDGPTVYRSDDIVGDPFLLADGSVPGDGDPATDLVATYHTTFELDRAGAKDLREWLADQRPPGARVTAGLPLRRIVRPGPWEWFFLATEGDPTTPPEEPRVYQIAFQGPAGRSVAAVIPETNPLDGARDIVHYRQDPSEDGEVRHSALQTDAGSRKAGADGSIYYNAQADFVAISSPDGIQFVRRGPRAQAAFVPMAADTGGAEIGPTTVIDPILGAFRPEAWDGEVWDFGSAPDGPTAYIPIDAQVPALWQWLSLQLWHTEIPGQTFRLAGQAQSGVTLPSHNRYPFVSPLFAQLETPTPLVMALDFEGEPLVFDQLQVDPVTGAPSGYQFRHGLVGYGLYCVDSVSIPEDAGAWSDATGFSSSDAQQFAAMGDDVARALGTRCFRVTEAQGLHHAAAWAPWLGGQAPDGFAVDPTDPFNLAGVGGDG